MTRLNLGSGIYVIDGMNNHDPVIDGWRFQDGLVQYPDGSVEGITICHALSQAPLEDWPLAFSEFARVLEPGGVVRIQDDVTDDPAAPHFGGFPGVKSLTTAALVREHMEAVGLTAFDVGPDETWFTDRSLIQHLHRGPPLSFCVEGVKP